MRRRAEVHKHAVTERISTVRRDEAKLIKMREKKQARKNSRSKQSGSLVEMKKKSKQRTLTCSDV